MERVCQRQRLHTAALCGSCTASMTTASEAVQTNGERLFWCRIRRSGSLTHTVIELQRLYHVTSSKGVSTCAGDVSGVDSGVSAASDTQLPHTINQCESA